MERVTIESALESVLLDEGFVKAGFVKKPNRVYGTEGFRLVANEGSVSVYYNISTVNQAEGYDEQGRSVYRERKVHEIKSVLDGLSYSVVIDEDVEGSLLRVEEVK